VRNEEFGEIGIGGRILVACEHRIDGWDLLPLFPDMYIKTTIIESMSTKC